MKLQWIETHTKEHLEQGDPCPVYMEQRSGGDRIFLCNICGNEYVEKAKETDNVNS